MDQDKILVVDDEGSVRGLLQRIVERMGYLCTSAADAKEAREYLERQAFHLLLCDIRMPGESGLDLIRHVRKQYPDTAIVMVTVLDDPQEAGIALEIGVYGYIIKPFGPSHVMISVKNALRMRDLEMKEKFRLEELEKLCTDRTLALQESEGMFRVTIEHSIDGIAIFKDGKPIYANNPCALMLGYGSPEELIGKPLAMLIHPDDRDRLIDLQQRRQRGEEGLPSRVEARWIRKDGNAIHVEASASRTLFQGGPVTLVFLRDISERKRIQTALLRKTRALETTQRLIIKNHEELEAKTVEIDENRKRLLRALEEISSLIRHAANKQDFKVRFKNPNLIKCYEAVDCKKIDCQCHGKEAMRCWQVRGTFCRKGPKANFPQKLSNCEECILFKQVCQDPYSRIGEYFNNMMHILDGKNQDLQDAYKRLKSTQSQILQQEKMASIGQLAAGVAHEINNPTGFVSSNLKTLGDYQKELFGIIEEYQALIAALNDKGITKDPEVILEKIGRIRELEAKRDLDFIMEDIPHLIEESREGMERIKKIVIDLKDFAHPGKQELVHADLNKNLDSTLNIVWNELKYRAKVLKDFGDLPEIHCYPQQLNQVFMNILVNGAQAIENQGEIAISTRADNGHVEVRISDTGKGISEENLPRIFDPFFTTKEVGKGTGLGLHVAYNIVKKHKGSIQVESKVGKGTTFTIRLPVNGGIEEEADHPTVRGAIRDEG